MSYSFSNVNIVVTGATGLVGNSIVNKLKNRKGITVFPIIRKSTRYHYENSVKPIFIDILETDFESKLYHVCPDVIIHCAAQIPTKTFPDSSKIYDVNSAIDDKIIRIVKELNSQLVYMSSTIVYGLPDNVYSIKEDYKLSFKTFYATQKIHSENKILQKLETGVILRLNAPYGNNMNNSTVLSSFINSALNDGILQYHGRGGRMQDFTHVEDIASLIYEMVHANNFKKGVYNIASGSPTSMKELAFLVVKIVNSSSKIQPSGLIDEQENYKASYNIDKVKLAFNWNPQVKLDVGIEMMAKIKKN